MSIKNLIGKIELLPHDGQVQLLLTMPRAKWQSNPLLRMLLEKAADLGITVSLVDPKEEKPQ